jgi:hypothetical protein
MNALEHRLPRARPCGRSARRRLPLVPILALGCALGPLDAEAQVRRGRALETAPPWTPVAFGARFGWDQRANGEVLGAHVSIPLLRNGIVELVPNAEMVFLTGTKEYQYSIETAFVPGGAGGLFVGGGVGWRDTVFGSLDPDDPRTTYFGYVVAVGAKGGRGRLQFQVTARWTFLDDTEYRPNATTIGLNYLLWNPGREGS